MAGADILVYPTAIGWLIEEKESFGQSQLASWQTVMKAHAITNGLFVVAPNRTGVEGNIEFWGHSFIANPYGELIDDTGDSNETIVQADCDLNLIDTARTHWPFLRDRRIDAYSDLTKIFADG
jgi:N-carbamoylputrescine amidase